MLSIMLLRENPVEVLTFFVLNGGRRNVFSIGQLFKD